MLMSMSTSYILEPSLNMAVPFSCKSMGIPALVICQSSTGNKLKDITGRNNHIPFVSPCFAVDDDDDDVTVNDDDICYNFSLDSLSFLDVIRVNTCSE